MTDDELTEVIARELTEAMYGPEVEEQCRDLLPGQADRLLALYRKQGLRYATALVPIVRAQQAEALRDAADWLDTFDNTIPAKRLRARADRIEKGADQ